MTPDKPFLIKFAFALLVALPLTVLYLEGALLFALVVSALQGSTAFYFVFGAWLLAGLVGLIGLWIWVFLRAGATRQFRVQVSCFVGTGVVALSPVTIKLVYLDGHSLLAALGVVAGIVICVWLAWPQAPFNPDPDTASRSDADHASSAGP